MAGIHVLGLEVITLRVPSQDQEIHSKLKEYEEILGIQAFTNMQEYVQLSFRLISMYPGLAAAGSEQIRELLNKSPWGFDEFLEAL